MLEATHDMKRWRRDDPSILEDEALAYPRKQTHPDQKLVAHPQVFGFAEGQVMGRS